MTKYDTKLGHCNDFKVANKKLWDFHLISKLTDWNLKLLESEDVWLLYMVLDLFCRFIIFITNKCSR